MNPAAIDSVTERVLVVAADAILRSRLCRALDELSFDVGEASSSTAALTHLRAVDYEAIVMECVVFETDSLAICGQLRRSYPRLPILIITTQNNLDHKIAAFEAGVDDFITRPIHDRELAARIRAAVRRFRAQAVKASDCLVIGEILLDPTRHRVEKSGVEVLLSPAEFRLLEFLMQQPGRAVPHSVIAATLWGEETEAHRKHLRVIVRSMRGKLEDDPSNPKYLITHSYFGYSFGSQ